MCIDELPKEKECLKETIQLILKSIEKGEKKLIKIFRNNETR